MPNIIKILDPHEAIKIAAGEVIERPAHIIKELIENSIDAGAQNISLYLGSAGKDLIKITDDGRGMSPLDAKLCFMHHATSKISTVDDLQSITTYGFRGEALSSIAAVSHVQLITKTTSEKLATSITVEHGKITSESKTSHQTGSTFIISKLFDNIPARKKFLKSHDTEWNGIVTIFQAFCLRFSHINFKLFHNDHLAYHCPATTNIKTRCAQLWSTQLHDQLVELTTITHQDPKIISMTISGAISKPHYYRFNRGQIFTFVNNRWVKNHELSKAILKGYDGVLPNQKYPAAFLFIDINPAVIDVNIHPKKEEVKFLHPNIVQQYVLQSVKDSLSSMISQSLGTNTSNVSSDIQSQPSTPWLQQFDSPFKDTHKVLDVSPSQVQERQENEGYMHLKNPAGVIKAVTDDTIDSDAIRFKYFAKQNVSSNSETNTSQQKTVSLTTHQVAQPLINQKIYQEEPYSIVGQFKKTYIIIEKEEQMILIDQHAAHERILYERFKQNLVEIATVQLLFPHIIKLSEHELITISHLEQTFKQHGIIFEPFSDRELLVQATPVTMSVQSAEEIIRMVIAWTLEHQHIPHEQLFAQLHENIITQKACKAATRAGDTLSHEQMQDLINQISKTPNNFCCPHGRPTMWSQSLKDIEKHFKRDYAGAKEKFTNLF